MNKTKFLTITSIALLLINLVLLGFMVMRPAHHKHPPPAQPKHFIQKKLNLDAAQVEAYEGLINDHQTRLKPMREDIQQLRKSLFSVLSKTAMETTKDSLLYELGEAQKKVEALHLEHFSNLKGICTKDQLPAYEQLVGELAELFSPHHKPPRK